jgi:hypothetical protein
MKLSRTILINTSVNEEIFLRKYFELNENENATHKHERKSKSRVAMQASIECIYETITDQN